MFNLWRKAKAAGAFVVSLSLVLPSVGHASMAQVRSGHLPAPLSQTAIPDSIPNVVQVEHRRHGQSTERRPYRHDARRDHRRDSRADRARKRDWYQRQSRLRNNYNDRARHHRKVYRDRPGYRGGYRGYNNPRRGYRRDNRDGLFYPLAAFALGAVIVNELNNNQPRRQTVTRGWSHIPSGNVAAHDNWCDAKYRSYRRSDKTFQPYNGPRRYCNSPYDAI